MAEVRARLGHGEVDGCRPAGFHLHLGSDRLRCASAVGINLPSTRWNPVDREGAIALGHRESSVWQHEDGRRHLRMDVAIDVDDAALGKDPRTTLPGAELTEVELAHQRWREDVVIERVAVRERHLLTCGD